MYPFTHRHFALGVVASSFAAPRQANMRSRWRDEAARRAPRESDCRGCASGTSRGMADPSSVRMPQAPAARPCDARKPPKYFQLRKRKSPSRLLTTGYPPPRARRLCGMNCHNKSFTLHVAPQHDFRVLAMKTITCKRRAERIRRRSRSRTSSSSEAGRRRIAHRVERSRAITTTGRRYTSTRPGGETSCRRTES